jgi:tetratricopeptide (TPR) repeat protein
MRFLFALLLAANLTTAQDWFQLAQKRHDEHDYRGALEAYTKARELGYAQAFPLALRTARVQAQLGDKEAAIATLQQAAANGFGNVDALLAENELLPIRTDARWKDVVAATRRNQHPCAAAAEYRQFDYWLGEWDVFSGGQKIARSSIQAILDDCVVFENYATLDGRYAGKSLNIWIPAKKQWEQRYMDTTGGSHEWIGALDGDHLVFTYNYEQNGVKTMQRMSYLKEGADQVRQKIDVSTDEGKTWNVSYDGLYVRRK